MATLKLVLDGLTEAIAADETVAAASFDAHATLVGVTEVDVATGHHTFKVDEPEALGGTDLAANPVQLVLARVEGDIDLRGFFGIDDAIRPGFTRIRLFLTVRGPEPQERYAELIDAVNVHCPVLDIVANPVPIEREVKIA